MNRIRFMLARVMQGLGDPAHRRVNFLLVHAAPGDPVSVLAGEAGASDPQFVAQLRAQFGLDQPILHAAGQLSRACAAARPGILLPPAAAGAGADPGAAARHAAADRALPLSCPCCSASRWALCARRPAPGSTAHHGGGAGVLCHAAVLAGADGSAGVHGTARLAAGLRLQTVGSGATGALRLGHRKHLVLPALTLALFYMAVYARMTRAAMLEVAQMDFVKTARAKGVPARPHPARARAAQRAAAGGHARGHPGRRHDRRRGADRDRVRLARHRPPDVRRAAAARLQPAAGRLPRDRRHGRAVQPHHRPRLHAGRSPDRTMTMLQKSFLAALLPQQGRRARPHAVLVLVACWPWHRAVGRDQRSVEHGRAAVPAAVDRARLCDGHRHAGPRHLSPASSTARASRC
jgi:peptide/nickel transport system permease protein